MEIKRVTKEVDGSVQALLILSPEESSLILSAGLSTLMQLGLMTVVDVSEEEYLAEKAKAETDGIDIPLPVEAPQQTEGPSNAN